MNRERRLTLRRETLSELTAGDLTRVVAGQSDLVTCTVTTDGVTCTQATLTFCPDYYCTGTC